MVQKHRVFVSWKLVDVPFDVLVGRGICTLIGVLQEFLGDDEVTLIGNCHVLIVYDQRLVQVLAFEKRLRRVRQILEIG